MSHLIFQRSAFLTRKLFIVILIVSAGCGSPITKETWNTSMKEYRFGRFAFSLPENFILSGTEFIYRNSQLRTIPLPKGSAHAEAVETVVNARFAEISQQSPPEANWIDGVIIEQRYLKAGPYPVYALCYYGHDADPESIYWDAFFDYGTNGLWVPVEGFYRFDEDPDREQGFLGVLDQLDAPRFERYKEKLVADFMEIGQAYRPAAGIGKDEEKNWFYLQHGAIAQPYRWNKGEEFSARFVNQEQEVEFNIEIATDSVRETSCFTSRTCTFFTSVFAYFAYGFTIDSIRSGKRTVAGLKGREAIYSMGEKKREEVTFYWEFPGEENSGEKPYIKITMETENPDAIKELTKLWDTILDSMRPIGR